MHDSHVFRTRPPSRRVLNALGFERSGRGNRGLRYRSGWVLAVIGTVGCLGAAASGADPTGTPGSQRLPLQRFQRFGAISARPAGDGTGLLVQWFVAQAAQTDIELQRAETRRTNWASIARGRGLTEYVDREARAGTRYDYQILTNGRSAELRLTAGVRLPPIEDRGAVALLVDETLASGLGTELQRLERDLVADGWRVIRHDVPRHDDDKWSRNTNAIARIRALIRQDWESTGQTL